ncbi:hypothetical protein FD755_021337 [Muntiacus reevesi]|uniref:t-SNARE coiled-coil homology domain-containing protein n=1 Tax=Muntiacus reevesi TaxID=9886 RepID=A0A5N3X325_MUNRE|nr:hypothetical protein FD755_021337 [Muntiacus reevesi]
MPYAGLLHPEPLFSTYDSTCQIAQEIAEKVQQRNQYERNGENTTKLTVTIRALLQKLKEKIALLKDLLLRAVATHQMSSLMTGGAKRGAPNPWLLEEPEETRGLGFDEIRQQQQKIIQEQDAGLDALSSIISRQKQMGQEIGNKLDEQNVVDKVPELSKRTEPQGREVRSFSVEAMGKSIRIQIGSIESLLIIGITVLYPREV